MPLPGYQIDGKVWRCM